MTDAAQIFNYKPALLAGSRGFSVFADRVEAGSGGENEVIAFADIKSCRFAVTTAREYRFRRLDLTSADDRVLKIAITTSIATNAKNDADLAAFYQLIDALAGQLITARPELSVTYSETAKVIWIMFLIGAAALLAAGGMLALAIATNVSDKKLMNALFPMGLMAALGLFTCVNSNPFKPQPVLAWPVFREIVRGLSK